MEKRATPQEFGVVPSGFLYRLVSELFKMVMEAMAHRHRLINIYIYVKLYLLNMEISRIYFCGIFTTNWDAPVDYELEASPPCQLSNKNSDNT